MIDVYLCFRAALSAFATSIDEDLALLRVGGLDERQRLAVKVRDKLASQTCLAQDLAVWCISRHVGRSVRR